MGEKLKRVAIGSFVVIGVVAAASTLMLCAMVAMPEFVRYS